VYGGGGREKVHYHTQLGFIREAESLVLQHHYTHRCPTVMQYVGTMHTDGGLFGDQGQTIAAVIFAQPFAKWREPVLELTRLVRHPNHKPPLTQLIAKTCDAIKRAGKFDLLISYADTAESHHGGVYQAASWNYHGLRAVGSSTGLIIDGAYTSDRTLSHEYGTRSATRIREITGKEVMQVNSEGKHLYWRALNKRGNKRAKRLDLETRPYPKTDEA
jgi:hypothetical protein